MPEDVPDPSFSEWLRDTYHNTVSLFRGSIAKVTLLMLFINFAIQFGYYGLWLWFPELFNKLDEYYDEHPNAHKTVCEVTDLSTDDDCPSDDPFCDCDARYKPDNEVFVNSFIISIAALPGNVWTIWQMDKLGRKFFLGEKSPASDSPK